MTITHGILSNIGVPDNLIHEMQEVSNTKIQKNPILVNWKKTRAFDNSNRGKGASPKIYVMTQRILNQRKTKGSKENCQTCGKKIKVGDSVLTPSGMRSNARSIRHEECARRVNLIA